MMDFYAISQECAPWVAPPTMAAIVKTESAFRPLAIGVNGGAKLVRQPENKEEAVVTAKWLIAAGYSIDIGLGQVNSANLEKVGLSVEDAFEPCKNVAAAGTILHRNYTAAKGKIQDEQAALQAALSAYNTGSFSKGFANGYVQRVVNNAVAVAPAGSVPAVTPIPLVGATKAPRTSPRSTADNPVKLMAERAGEATTQTTGVNVYGSHRESVMVY